jgi:hypothetical protein
MTLWPGSRSIERCALGRGEAPLENDQVDDDGTGELTLDRAKCRVPDVDEECAAADLGVESLGFDRVIPGRYGVIMVAESCTSATAASTQRSGGHVTFDTRWDDDPGRERIPPGLDTMSPGPVLAGWLSSIDRSRLSGQDRIIVLRADQKMASHYAARVYGDMASVVDAMSDFEDLAPDFVSEAAAAEVRAALRLTRQAADGEMALAWTCGTAFRTSSPCSRRV